MNLDFEVVVFYLITLANRQNNKNWWGGKWYKYFHDRQITRNNFVDKGKKDILSANTSQNFALVCMIVFGFHGFRLSSFVICFNVVEFILIWQNVKTRNTLPWSKTARLCQNADDPQRRVVNGLNLNLKPQARTWHLCSKPDLGPKAKLTEWVKMCATAWHQ